MVESEKFGSPQPDKLSQAEIEKLEKEMQEAEEMLRSSSSIPPQTMRGPMEGAESGGFLNKVEEEEGDDGETFKRLRTASSRHVRIMEDGRVFLEEYRAGATRAEREPLSHGRAIYNDPAKPFYKKFPALQGWWHWDANKGKDGEFVFDGEKPYAGAKEEESTLKPTESPISDAKKEVDEDDEARLKRLESELASLKEEGSLTQDKPDPDIEGDTSKLQDKTLPDTKIPRARRVAKEEKKISRKEAGDDAQTPEGVADAWERAGKAQQAMEEETKRKPPPLPRGSDFSFAGQLGEVRAMVQAEKEMAESGIDKTIVKWRPEGVTQTLAEHMGEPEENWVRKTVPGVTEDQARVLDSTIDRTRAEGERREAVVEPHIPAEDADAQLATWRQRFSEEKNTFKYWLTPRFMRRNEPQYGSLREFWERTIDESKDARIGLWSLLVDKKRGTANAPLALSAEALKGLREHQPNSPDGRRWMALANREVEMQREIYARGHTKFFARKNFKGVPLAGLVGAGAGILAFSLLSAGVMTPLAVAVGGLTSAHMRNYLVNNEARGSVVIPILWGGIWTKGVSYGAQAIGLDQIVNNTIDRLVSAPSESLPPSKQDVPAAGPKSNTVPQYGGERLAQPTPTNISVPDGSTVSTPDIVRQMNQTISFPAEYTVSAGDSVARHGIDGFMRTGLLDTPYFKQLGLSDLARNQFIEAVRDVFTQNPELAEKFGGRIIEGRDGLDLAFTAGDKLDASVWREPEFLKELGERLRSGNYTVIDSSMRGKGGVQAIIRQLAAIKYT